MLNVSLSLLQFKIKARANEHLKLTTVQHPHAEVSSRESHSWKKKRGRKKGQTKSNPNALVISQEDMGVFTEQAPLSGKGSIKQEYDEDYVYGGSGGGGGSNLKVRRGKSRMKRK